MDFRLKLADSSLDHSTKEEREVERLIDREPAPSRKPKQRRGPKHDNRRRRIKTDDPDMDSSDKDMSLNYKHSSLLAIAARIADDAPKKAPQKPRKLQVESEPLPKLPEEAHELQREIGDISPELYRSFEKFTEKNFLEAKAPADKIAQWCKQQADALAKIGSQKIQGAAGRVADKITSLWPSDPYSFGAKAGTIRAIEKSMEGSGLPKSFVNVFRKSHDSKKNRQLVRELIDDNRTLSEQDLEQGDFIAFAALAAALPLLRSNPDKLDSAKLKASIDQATAVVYDQAKQVITLKKFIEAWTKAAGGTSFQDAKSQTGKPTEDAHKFLDEASSALRSFTERKDPILDPKNTIRSLKEELQEKFGQVPPELEGMLKSASQTPYGREVIETMSHKTATYHGVVGQGHPEGATNSQHALDKRHFSKEHYDSIIAHAEELLKEDWLQYAWDGGAADAPLRAALDLSIHTADRCQYQGKIDGETYNMLLNRLAGWGHDTFQDTLLSEKNRTASMAEDLSQPNIRAILSVASDLRNSDPKQALEVVKGLRRMISSVPTGFESFLAQDGLSEKDLEELPEAKVEMKDLKDQSKKLVDAKNVDDFMSGLQGLSETMKKSASTRIAAAQVRIADELDKLEVLEDMSDDEVKKLLDEQKAKAKELESKAGLDDIDGFLKGLDEMFSSLEEAAKHVETASVRVQVATLVRIAKSSPEAFQALRPLLVIAKKKMDKKKSKKTSQKKEEKSEEKPKAKADAKDKEEPKAAKKGDAKKSPFGGKKAPPFSGKKAPPFKKKASVEDISASDTEW